jgi:hypothetical protein
MCNIFDTDIPIALIFEEILKEPPERDADSDNEEQSTS